MSAIEAGIAESQPEMAETQRMVFTGNAKEYFGIWIVNLILTLLTIGIYSAWAKVRRITYFHSNTVILGDRLAYHATGWMILKGRLIAVAVIAALSISSYISPFLQLGLSLAIIPVIPWVINQSLRFQTRMTSWRNVRFNWTGTYWQALKAMVLWPMAAFLSLGILLPLATRANHALIAGNLRFGKTPFEAELPGKSYYRVLGMAVLLALPAAGLSVAWGLWFWSVATPAPDGGLHTENPGVVVTGALVITVGGLWMLSLFLYYQVRTRNILVNALRLRNAASLATDMKTRRIVWITLTNTLVIPLTLFLMLPWAVVRLYRYTVESTLVTPRADLPEFLDETRDDTSAFGEEFGAMEGIDISI